MSDKVANANKIIEIYKKHNNYANHRNKLETHENYKNLRNP